MKQTLLAVGIGIIVGASVSYLFTRGDSETSSESAQSGEKPPLYWVAPMDPNYRRDKPGKSPMGMDLIPVYEKGGSDASPGTISISPDVVNNLGVRTAKVERRAMHTEIKTVGYVQYDEDQLIHIHPRVDGWIEILHVKAAGDPVEKGQPLYELYSPQLVNAQEEMILAVNRENPRLLKAAEDRLRALQISDAFIKDLKKTRRVRQTLTFYAPQSGVIDNLNIREGFFVKPGTTLMSIGNLDEVWVEAEVFERQASLVESGLPVTMTLDYLPGRVWQGKVGYVYPTLDAKTRTAGVRLRFENADGLLKPNMFAQVTIHAEGDDSVLMIPREAVIRTGKQDRVVLAKGEGRFKSVAVGLGRIGDEYVEVVKGLDEDEEVVTSAQFLLDSESSKSSDFSRLDHGDDEVDSVWVAAKITGVMTGHRMITVEHDVIAEWEWPAMTMDFVVADEVDIAPLVKGTELHMQISKTGKEQYQVTGTHILASPSTEEVEKTNSAQVNGVINSIDHMERVLNVSREAIKKWNRPATTMDFIASEAINLGELSAGDAIHFRFHVNGGNFTIDQVQKLDKPLASSHDHNPAGHNGGGDQ